MSQTSDDGVTAGALAFDPMTYGLISAFSAIAWYNAIEINAQVFLTFKKRRGLYFWSLLITSWGIAVHVLSFILKFFVPSANWVLCATLTTIGWYPMVTGQSIVLYSRLHLVVRDPRILRFVLVMIIVDAVCFHIPTTVLTFGTNSPDPGRWKPGFDVMERLQMTAFMVQEFIISGIYVWATLRLMKPVYHARPRKVMTHLIYINLIIIAMDVVLLVVEFTNYYKIQASLKPMVYSIKLKLEFAVLNQLMVLANTGVAEAGPGGSEKAGPPIPVTPTKPSRRGDGDGDGGLSSQAAGAAEQDQSAFARIVKTQNITIDSEAKGRGGGTSSSSSLTKLDPLDAGGRKAAAGRASSPNPSFSSVETDSMSRASATGTSMKARAVMGMSSAEPLTKPRARDPDEPWGTNVGGPNAPTPKTKANGLGKVSDRMFDGSQHGPGGYQARAWHGRDADAVEPNPYKSFVGTGVGAGSNWGRGVTAPKQAGGGASLLPTGQGVVGDAARRQSVDDFGGG
ncbi:MAG: hypothetical protein M1832_001984 [Thelocarpon impressellum]|nr:MAG: hypothetical protein M1832_001984 [Thelocarpon impressellum]